MLRLATQGEPDRLGDQIAAALHGKGRRVVRICAHLAMYVYVCIYCVIVIASGVYSQGPKPCPHGPGISPPSRIQPLRASPVP